MQAKEAKSQPEPSEVPNSQKVTEEAKFFVKVDIAPAADSEGLTKVKQWIL